MNTGQLLDDLMKAGDEALALEKYHQDETGDLKSAEYYRGKRHGITKAIALVCTLAVSA